MSVFTRRMINAATTPLVVSIAALHDFKGLLEKARDSAGNTGYKEAYIDIVFLALVLVNGALNERGRDAYHARFAYQASTSALSVVASVQFLIPHLSSTNGEESKYVAALVPHLNSIKRSIVAGLENMIAKPSSSSLMALLRKSPSEMEADRVMKDMRTTLNAFLFKVSFFTERMSRHSGDPENNSDVDGHILSWRDIDLKTGCKIPSSYLQYISPQYDFWENTYQATIGETRAIVKTYPGNSFESFTQDLEILRAKRHSNLPLLFGFSNKRASIPFIALSLESYIPLFEYLAIMSARTPRTALGDTWKMVHS